MTTVPTETDGKFVNLRNISDALPVCGAITPSVASSCAASPGPLFSSNPTLHNFEPRIGFAWDALHNGRLAVRGGAGLFDVLPLPYQFTLLETQAIPFFQYDVFGKPAAGSFPFVSNLPACHVQYFAIHLYRVESKAQLRRPVEPQRAVWTQPGLGGYGGLYRVARRPHAIPSGRGQLGDSDVNVRRDICGPSAERNLRSGTPINPNFGSVRGMFYQGCPITMRSKLKFPRS